MKRTRYKMEGAILANDPSFRAWGWAVLDFNGNLLESGCIKTLPEDKKRRVRQGDDRVRRIAILSRGLLRIIKQYNVKIILMEEISFSKSANAAVMMGAVLGIGQTLGEAKRLPVEWYSESDAKINLFMHKNVSKQDMIKKIDKLYSVEWAGNKASNEAMADALAIYEVAATTSTALKLLKNG